MDNRDCSELIFWVEGLVYIPSSSSRRSEPVLFLASFSFDGEESPTTLPQFEPVRSASSLSTPHPSRNPKGFRNAFPTRLRRRTCARLLSRTDSRECWPIAIHLRRSFLRYRPSASRFGRGVAEESLTRLRTASRTHEPRQQELARLVLPPPAQSLAASAQPPRDNRGGIALAAL